MKNLCLLIKPRFLGLKNLFFRSRKEQKRRVLILSVLGLFFCVGLFFLSCRTLGYFQSIEIIGDLLARLLLSMMLLTFFSLLVFSHVISSLSNLFLSKDLELCHSTPVLHEEIFVVRSFFTFMDSSWMLMIFGMPVFMAYGYIYHAGPLFYFSLVHLNLAMAIIAAGIGILTTMLLVHFFPAQRMKDIVMLLSIAMLVALYLMFRFLRPERLVNPDAFFTVTQYVSALRAPQSPYLPTTWITDVLWGKLTGSEKGYQFETAFTWITAAAITVINIWTAQSVYFDGFSKSQEAKKRRMAGRKILDMFVFSLTFPFKNDVAAILGKDIRTFFRDNTQWSQLLLLSALVIVYVYNFSVLPLDKSPIRLDFIQNHLAFLNMGLAGFVLSAVSARFVFTSVSAEGEGYWIIRTSPLEMKNYLWGKYLFYVPFMIGLGEILIVATNHYLDVTPFMMMLSSITMFFLAFGIVALAIAFGSIYPNFRHQNIAQVATGFGGVLYMIVSMIFIGSIIVIEAWPVYVLFMADVTGRNITSFQWYMIAAAFLLVVVLCLSAVFVPMKLGLKALNAME